MTDDDVHIDLTDIEIELDLTALGIGTLGALLATASTFLPSLTYLGQLGPVLAANQLWFQIGGTGFVLLAAAIQAKRLNDDWGLHGRVMKQGVLAFVTVFLAVSYVTVPVLASSGNSGGTQQIQGENLKVAYLKVDGMVCQGCEASINGFLRNQPGVKSTDIQLAESGGPVVFDPSVTSAEELANGQIFQGYYDATVERVKQYQSNA